MHEIENRMLSDDVGGNYFVDEKAQL